MSKHFKPEEEREFFDHINAEAQARVEKAKAAEAWERAEAEAKRNKKVRLTRELARGLAGVAVMSGLYLAEHAELISPVLTNPVYVLAFVFIGWQLCKIEGLVKAK